MPASARCKYAPSSLPMYFAVLEAEAGLFASSKQLGAQIARWTSDFASPPVDSLLTENYMQQGFGTRQEVR